MNFINRKDITSSIAFSDGYMTSIDLYKTNERNLVKRLSKLGIDDQLLKDMNILGQNLTSINTKDYSYEHMGRQLQFDKLSRGEKVFLVSLAAKYTNTPIYLYNDITQLTKTSLRKFYTLFKDCNCINIIVKSESNQCYYEYAMNGEI